MGDARPKLRSVQEIGSALAEFEGFQQYCEIVSTARFLEGKQPAPTDAMEELTTIVSVLRWVLGLPDEDMTGFLKQIRQVRKKERVQLSQPPDPEQVREVFAQQMRKAGVQ